MKNLLIYINPKGFDKESEKLIKIQIENSLEFWKLEDIVLVTDFPYEYMGVKATVIDKAFCPFYVEASKITAIVRMFDLGLIGKELYWCHDLDAFQMEPFDERNPIIIDMGLTDYGRKPTYQMGSFFFRNSAEDLLRENARRLKPGLNEDGRHMQDETAMIDMVNENSLNVNSRVKRLNITYNFGMRKVGLCYKKALKPLKVLHFHPNSDKMNTLDIAMYGKNDTWMPLMTKRLIKLFKKYGYS